VGGIRAQHCLCVCVRLGAGAGSQSAKRSHTAPSVSRPRDAANSLSGCWEEPWVPLEGLTIGDFSILFVVEHFQCMLV
jgi:hypothetical protein